MQGDVGDRPREGLVLGLGFGLGLGIGIGVGLRIIALGGMRNEVR